MKEYTMYSYSMYMYIVSGAPDPRESSMRIPLACVVVYLNVAGVVPYTLYKWIADSRMRFNYDPDPRNTMGKETVFLHV